MTNPNRMMHPRRWPILVFLALVLAACGAAPPAPHTTITGDGGILRQAFNADTGKIRAVFLASPT